MEQGLLASRYGKGDVSPLIFSLLRLYQSHSFNRLSNNVWDKHSLERGFKYDCGVSGCPKTFTNQQSFRRHVKQKHSQFYESHMVYFRN